MQVQEVHEVTWKDKGFGFPVKTRENVAPPAELSRILAVLHTLSSAANDCWCPVPFPQAFAFSHFKGDFPL